MIAVGAIVGLLFGAAAGAPGWGLVCGAMLGAIVGMANGSARGQVERGGGTWVDTPVAKGGAALICALLVLGALCVAGLAAWAGGGP